MNLNLIEKKADNFNPIWWPDKWNNWAIIQRRKRKQLNRKWVVQDKGDKIQFAFYLEWLKFQEANYEFRSFEFDNKLEKSLRFAINIWQLWLLVEPEWVFKNLILQNMQTLSRGSLPFSRKHQKSSCQEVRKQEVFLFQIFELAFTKLGLSVYGGGLQQCYEMDRMKIER